jgi:hypothetical protein
LPKCQYSTEYYDYESGTYDAAFNCPEEEPLASGFRIFHDKDYLQDKTNYEEHKRKVIEKLRDKINTISNNEPLRCIGFHLPDFSLSDISIRRIYSTRVFRIVTVIWRCRLLLC